MRKHSKNMSMPGGICLGVGLAVVMTLVGALGLSYLVMAQRLEGVSIGYGAMEVLLLSALIGCIVAAGRVGHRRGLVCAVCGAGYFLALLVAGMAFGGMRQGIVPSFVCICLGGGIAATQPMLCKGSGGKKRRFKDFR